MYLPVPLNWVLDSIPLCVHSHSSMFTEHFAHVELRSEYMYIAFQILNAKSVVSHVLRIHCNCLYLHCCYIVFLLYLPVSSLPQQLMREHYTYYLTQLLGSQPLIPSFPRLLLLLSDIFHRGFFHFQPLYFFQVGWIATNFITFFVFICFHSARNFFPTRNSGTNVPVLTFLT